MFSHNHHSINEITSYLHSTINLVQLIEVEYSIKRCDSQVISNINIISHPINNQAVLFWKT